MKSKMLKIAVYCRTGNFAHACALAVQSSGQELIESYQDEEVKIQAFILADLWHKKKTQTLLPLRLRPIAISRTAQFVMGVLIGLALLYAAYALVMLL